MLEVEVFCELLLEKGIISKDELVANFRRLRIKGESKCFKMDHCIGRRAKIIDLRQKP
jgi:hypothetical protein